MADKRSPNVDPGQPAVYQVRIQGHLGHTWTEWFAGFSITLEAGGVTCLTGPVADQAELYGLLRRIRDLGVTLISVTRVGPGPDTTG
jgi:hypothetical protein